MHPHSRVDFIVVGSGPGGCAAAARLARAGHRVVLLEAGPASGGLPTKLPAAWPKLFKSKLDWNDETTPQPQLDNRRIYWPRGRMLGGCSAMNAQMVIRGAATDFDAWAHAGCDGWDHASLLPDFRAVERNSRGASAHHGADGPWHVSDPIDPHRLSHAFVAACGEAGIAANPDFNGERLDGAGLAQVIQHRGVRHSAAAAYLRERMPGLTVRTDAQATRLEFDAAGRAVGVRFRDGRSGEVCTLYAEREVILAAGALNTPQLLLLSGIGPARELERLGIAVRHDLPGVGANLHDHPVVPMWAATHRQDSMLAAESPIELLRYVFRRRGMLTSNIAEAAAFFRSSAAAEAPDLEIVFVPVLFLGQGLVAPTEHGFTLGVTLLTPRSRGTLRLASTDPRERPIIDPRYLADPSDLATLRHGCARAIELMRAPSLAKEVSRLIGPQHAGDSAAIDRHIRANLHTLYHPAGTCRMGRDRGAVVAPDLSVHGVAGLRIADASVMPTLMRGHPQMVTAVIGERAARHAAAACNGVAVKARRDEPLRLAA